MQASMLEEGELGETLSPLPDKAFLLSIVMPELSYHHDVLVTPALLLQTLATLLPAEAFLSGLVFSTRTWATTARLEIPRVRATLRAPASECEFGSLVSLHVPWLPYLRPDSNVLGRLRRWKYVQSWMHLIL
eukprot:3931770-Rhodomonas_salina.1